MGKRKIDSFDSVEFTNEWQFVKEKKQRIKIKAERAVNSEFYLTFTDVTALYTYLYLSLAPEEAFNFQKVQPILQKMRGESQEERRIFEDCKRTLSSQWNGETPLSETVRKTRGQIGRQQKHLYDISSRITEDEAKQLLRSGLSQRRVHLDYHTNDGQTEEQIIPTIQGVNNCITVISDPNINKFLLAFFSYVEEREEDIKSTEASQRQTNTKAQINQQTHTNAHTFEGRPVHRDAPNPDDRPLPAPQNANFMKNAERPPERHGDRPHGQIVNPDDRPLPQPEQIYRDARVPSHPRNIVDPDERPLNPPPRAQGHVEPVKPVPTVPRVIMDPDEKLLPPPAKEQRVRRPSDSQKQNKPLHNSTNSKINSSNVQQKQLEQSKLQQVKEDIKHVAEVTQEKAHELGEKVMDLGRRAEQKIQEVIDEIRHDNRPWMQWAIAGGIVFAAVNILRA